MEKQKEFDAKLKNDKLEHQKIYKNLLDNQVIIYLNIETGQF